MRSTIFRIVDAITAVLARLRDEALRTTIRLATPPVRDDRGQTVAEYALVLLVAAAIAGAFLLWARSSGRLDAFFDAIFERLLGSVDPQPTPTPAA